MLLGTLAHACTAQGCVRKVQIGNTNYVQQAAWKLLLIRKLAKLSSSLQSTRSQKGQQSLLDSQPAHHNHCIIKHVDIPFHLNFLGFTAQFKYLDKFTADMSDFCLTFDPIRLATAHYTPHGKLTIYININSDVFSRQMIMIMTDLRCSNCRYMRFACKIARTRCWTFLHSHMITASR